MEKIDTTKPLVNEDGETLVICSNCSEKILEDESYTVEDEIFCKSCESECCFYCDKCDQMCIGEAHAFHNDRSWCESCADRHLVQCNSCDEYLEQGEDSIFNIINGDCVCEPCFCEYYGTCEDCGENFNRDNLNYHEYDECDYCDDCYNEHNQEKLETIKSEKIKNDIKMINTVELSENAKDYLDNFYDCINPFKNRTNKRNKLIEFKLNFESDNRKQKMDLDRLFSIGLNKPVVILDNKYLEYKKDDKMVKIKIRKYFNIVTKNNEHKDYHEKNLEKYLKEFTTQENYTVKISNHTDHKLIAARANYKMGSCQVSSHQNEYSTGFGDFLVNSDLLVALVFQNGDCVARMILRRFRHYSEREKTFYLFDRIYSIGGGVANSKYKLQSEIINKVNNKLGKNEFIALPKRSKHDKSVSSKYLEHFSECKYSNGTDCFKNKTSATVDLYQDARPLYRSCYYHDSGTYTKKINDEKITDMINSNDFIILHKTKK